jgi:hypothetical protein
VIETTHGIAGGTSSFVNEEAHWFVIGVGHDDLLYDRTVKFYRA